MSKIINDLKNKIENKTENLFEETNKLLKNTPMISQDVYNNLPSIFDNILKDEFIKDNNRIKDLMLLSTLTSLSSIFPKVSGIYFSEKIFPNLYFFSGAKAASGKSSIKVSIEILSELEKYEDIENAQKLREYNLDLEEYELSTASEKKEKVKPILPIQKNHTITANITDSRLLDKIAAGSSLMFSTEADELSTAIANQHGSGMNNILRSCYQHESIGKDRVGSGTLKIDEPKLSLCVSGTLDQLFSVLGKSENGLFSRFMIYAFQNDYKYISPAPTTTFKQSRKEYIAQNVSPIIFEIMKKWDTNDVNFDLTEEQWVMFNKFCVKLHKKMEIIDDREIETILNRYFLMCYKITMILTCLRKYDTFNTLFDETLYPSTIDILSSQKIVYVLAKHMSLIYYSQEETVTTLRENKLEKSVNLINSIDKEEFTKQDLLNLFMNSGISERTIERTTNKMIKSNMIEKINNKTFKKIIKKNENK